jgi:hypothetical protein
MARASQQPPAEESSGGPGLWVVSFNDCMTNMLCFFVLLVSFSSFDPDSRSQLTGSLRAITLDSVLPDKPSEPSFVAPPPQNNDVTEFGANVRTQTENTVTHRPRPRPFISDTSVYRDRQEIMVDSHQLFLARGTALTEQGRDGLASLAGLLKFKPAHVIVSEAGLTDAVGRPDPLRSLERASAIVEFLVAGGSASRDYFAVAQASPQDMPPLPMVRITILNREMSR